MSTYDIMRHFADSWGLVFMAVVFVICVAWTFRPRASEHHERAANMIFDQDENNG